MLDFCTVLDQEMVVHLWSCTWHCADDQGRDSGRTVQMEHQQQYPETRTLSHTAEILEIFLNAKRNA